MAVCDYLPLSRLLKEEVITQNSGEGVFSEACFAVFVSHCFDVYSEDITSICHTTQCQDMQCNHLMALWVLFCRTVKRAGRTRCKDWL